MAHPDNSDTANKIDTPRGRGVTVQVYLPDGNPMGIREAELAFRTSRAVLIPRSLLPAAAGREALRGHGVVCLFDPGGALIEAVASGDCYATLRELEDWEEDRESEWLTAIVLLSSADAFTAGHTVCLARLCRRGSESNTPSPANVATAAGESVEVTEFIRAECAEMIDTMKLLVSVLGFPGFDRGVGGM